MPDEGHVWKVLESTPLRVLTDVPGEPFWTIVVAEETVKRIDDFFAIEKELMANETVLSEQSAAFQPSLDVFIPEIG